MLNTHGGTDMRLSQAGIRSTLAELAARRHFSRAGRRHYGRPPTTRAAMLISRRRRNDDYLAPTMLAMTKTFPSTAGGTSSAFWTIEWAHVSAYTAPARQATFPSLPQFLSRKRGLLTASHRRRLVRPCLLAFARGRKEAQWHTAPTAASPLYGQLRRGLISP